MSSENNPIEQQGFWKDHSAAWKVSGLTQQEYCEQKNISFRSFIYQHNRLASKSKPSSIKFIETKPDLNHATQQSAGLQLMLPNGVRVGISNEVNIKLVETVLTLAGALRC